MKPSPPDHLLAKGQAWTVVEAPWGLLPGPFKDQFACTFYRCGLISVIYSLDEARILMDTLCDEHMGSHRWIEDGKVMQWKANPPWVYRKPAPRRVRSRKDWLV